MTHNKKITAGGLTTIALTCGFAVFVAYSSLQNFVAEKSRELVPGNATIEQKYQTLKNMPQADREKLVNRERKVLVTSPLDYTALQNLMLLNEIGGDPDKVLSYGTLAARRTLHDTRSQIIALQAALRDNKFEDALYRLDGLMRINLEERPAYFDVLLNLAANKKALPAVGKLLATNPPWRPAFMDRATRTSKQQQVIYGILNELRNSPAPPTVFELEGFFSKQIYDKSFEFGHFVWLDFLSTADLSKADLLFDGGFELPIRNNYFGWTYWPVKNAEIKFVQRQDGNTNRVLQASFAGGRVPFYNLLQYVRLAPGEYRLSGQKKSDDLVTPSGLEWHLLCAEDNRILVHAGRVSVTEDWNEFSESFTIPENNCATQYLRLSSAGLAELDNVISGRILYDNLVISHAN